MNTILKINYEEKNMKPLDLNQVADYLADATILQTLDGGVALVHYGITNAGHNFFLINDVNGNSSVTEFL